MAEEVKVTFKTEQITIKKDDKEDVKLEVGTSYKVLVKNCVKVYKLENNNITEDAESKETLQIRIVVGNYVGYAGTEELDEATKDTFLAFEKVKDNDTDKTQLYIKVDDIQSIEPDQSAVDVATSKVANDSSTDQLPLNANANVETIATLKKYESDSGVGKYLNNVIKIAKAAFDKAKATVESATNEENARPDVELASKEFNDADSAFADTKNFLDDLKKKDSTKNVDSATKLITKSIETNKKYRVDLNDELNQKGFTNIVVTSSKSTNGGRRTKQSGGATKRRLSKKHKKTRKAKRSGRKA